MVINGYCLVFVIVIIPPNIIVQRSTVHRFVIAIITVWTLNSRIFRFLIFGSRLWSRILGLELKIAYCRSLYAAVMRLSFLFQNFGPKLRYLKISNLFFLSNFEIENFIYTKIVLLDKI